MNKLAGLTALHTSNMAVTLQRNKDEEKHTTDKFVT